MLKFLKRLKQTKEVPWYDSYKEKKTILQKIHETFRCLIAHLIWDRNWIWLEACISILCDFEMSLEVIKDKEFREELATMNVCVDEEHNTTASLNIPDDPMYCEYCPYQARSSVATFFYGYQSSGYCYYMGKGDYSFINPTDLLWDGCKCCGVNCNWDKLEEEVTKTYEEYMAEINKEKQE